MLSKREIEGLARKAVAAVIGAMLAFALLSALLIAGIVLLLWALTAGLTPLVGHAGALAVSGGVCFLLLGLFFWRLLSARATDGTDDEAGSEPKSFQERIKDMISKNPLEAALGAFTLGLASHTDPRFRAMLLQSGFMFMRQAENDAGGEGGGDGGAAAGEVPGQDPPESGAL